MVGTAEVQGGRRQLDAVFEIDAADTDGREDVGIFGAHRFHPFFMHPGMLFSRFIQV
jgi:hypothetical protein